jgi:hypothetical protein
VGVIFVDSFDHYDSADAGKKWLNFPSQYSLTTTACRTGTQGLEGTSNSSGLIGDMFSQRFTATTEMIAGFALYLVRLPTSDFPIAFFIDNVGPGDNTPAICIGLTSAGHLRIYGTSTLKSDNWTGTALTTGQWYYIEFKSKYHTSTGGSVGDTEIRVDYGSGPTVVNQIAANQTTNSGSGSGFIAFGFGADFFGTTSWTASSACFYIDDVYLLDATTGVNTTYLGNSSVNCVYPNGAGASAQFTPLSGSTNYTEVDEAILDDDTTYVHTTGTGNRDTYTLGTMPNSPVEIFAVQLVPFARVDAGETTRTMLSSLYIGSTYYDGATSGDLTSTYAAKINIWESNPATSTNFTRSDIQGMEAGVKLVS